MPYKLKGLCVVKSDTGETVKCHPDKASAVAHLQALMADVSDAKSAMKIGARNNAMDKATIKAIHDLCCQLDPECCDVMEETAESMESPAVEAAENMSGDSDEMMDESKKFNLTYIKSLHMSDDEAYMRDIVAVKSIGKNDIHGYLALWGDAKKVDLEREYFTPQSDLWIGKFGMPLPLTYDHAQDKATKSDPQIGNISQIGTDAVGVWYDAQLAKAHMYRKAVDDMIGEHVLGTSSDSVPQYVERVQTGKSVWLKRWPIVGGALTVTPCEPRMLTEGSPLFKATMQNISTRMGGLDSLELDALKRWHDVIRLTI